jgi:hypothetical protein
MGSRRGRGVPPVSAIATTSDWSAADGGGDSCRPRRPTSRRLCLLLKAEMSGSGAAPVLKNNRILECTNFYVTADKNKFW